MPKAQFDKDQRTRAKAEGKVLIMLAADDMGPAKGNFGGAVFTMLVGRDVGKQVIRFATKLLKQEQAKRAKAVRPRTSRDG